jgi:hypothetical protein
MKTKTEKCNISEGRPDVRYFESQYITCLKKIVDEGGIGCNPFTRFARIQKVRGFGVIEKEGCVVGIVKHAFLSSTDQVLPDCIWVRRVANNLFGTSGDEFVRRFPIEKSKIRNFSDRDGHVVKGPRRRLLATTSEVRVSGCTPLLPGKVLL